MNSFTKFIFILLIPWAILNCSNPSDNQESYKINGIVKAKVNSILDTTITTNDSLFLLDNLNIYLYKDNIIDDSTKSISGNYSFPDIDKGIYNIKASITSDIFLVQNDIEITDADRVINFTFINTRDSITLQTSDNKCTSINDTTLICSNSKFISQITFIYNSLVYPRELSLLTTAQDYYETTITLCNASGDSIWSQYYDNLCCAKMVSISESLSTNTVYFASVKDTSGFLTYCPIMR